MIMCKYYCNDCRENNAPGFKSNYDPLKTVILFKVFRISLVLTSSVLIWPQYLSNSIGPIGLYLFFLIVSLCLATDGLFILYLSS